MQPFHGSHLKLGRAGEHLDAAKRTVQEFVAGKPYALAIDPDPAPPNYALLARIVHTLPGDQLGLIIGDLAHNARSALDLLVQQLTSLPADDDKGRRKLQFPIFDSVEEYERYKPRYLKGVAPEHIALIDQFQPYQRTNGFDKEALWLLASINNADKHRVIHIVGAIGAIADTYMVGHGMVGYNYIQGVFPYMIGPGANIDFGKGVSIRGVGDGIISEDRTVVARITSPTAPELDMYSHIQVVVKFDEGAAEVKGRPVLDTLTFIYRRVKEVVGEFDRLHLP